MSNFFGWYLTVYVFYQIFSLYLRRQETKGASLSIGNWRLPVIFYGVSAAGNLPLSIPQPGPAVVYDASGTAWQVHAITGTSALVSILVMGAFTLLAWVRLSAQ